MPEGFGQKIQKLEVKGTVPEYLTTSREAQKRVVVAVKVGSLQVGGCSGCGRKKKLGEGVVPEEVEVNGWQWQRQRRKCV